MTVACLLAAYGGSISPWPYVSEDPQLCTTEQVTGRFQTLSMVKDVPSFPLAFTTKDRIDNYLLFV